jgi:hypothetical protein
MAELADAADSKSLIGFGTWAHDAAHDSETEGLTLASPFPTLHDSARFRTGIKSQLTPELTPEKG